jgi:hypothetical protein
MSRRSFGEGGFVVSKNKNALPGISRQGALKSAYETLFRITPDSESDLVNMGMNRFECSSPFVDLHGL